ncbi:MAG: DPP IV N-terminal domain-containing protein [Caldilineaceae bacterium]|nr:DPP IV N-terminal domain-containing protein [Caldilineaceae bacterium]
MMRGHKLFGRQTLLLPFWLLTAWIVTAAAPTRASAASAAQAAPAPITARMLTAPGALMGPAPAAFNWSPTGARLTYVDVEDGQDALVLLDAATGDRQILLTAANAPAAVDLSAAQWSPQGDALLLSGGSQLWLLDVATGDLRPVGDGEGAKSGVAFVPDGAHISYVQDNDLYVVAIAGGDAQRLTSDGGETVFNGILDWVYNEELATRAAQPAYAWSPDGARLIYLRLDESAVQSHPVTDYRPVPPTIGYTRYPTAGTANPTPSLHVIDRTGDAPPQVIPLPAGAEYVLPFFAWTPDGQEAIYATLNRDHTVLELLAWDLASAASRSPIRETAPDWINENSYAAPVFLGDGEQFLWLSERDGFMHLYLYSSQGELIRQLTQGEWLIDSPAWNLLTPGKPVHVDPTGAYAYFITTRTTPLERQIDRLDIATGELTQLSATPGFHALALSSDGAYLVDQFSNATTPPVTWLLHADGSQAAVLGEAAGPSLPLPQVTREFLTVPAADGTRLHAQLVKPADFDPNRRYPVVVHWYGGPTLQMVSNRYGATNIFNIIERDVLYTQAGFLVWRLDNRGAFGRGHAFEAPIFGELGPVALADQRAGIDYLRTLPYVDGDRIGSDGKSFGGFLTLYALIHAPDALRCGVAGAGPTDWSLYDTIYTERYMRTPAQNPDGYAATELISRAGQIEASPLLIHGLADTNVHLQNTVNFVEALEANDKLFDFIPLPNLSHSFHGDGLVAALSASVNYLTRCLGEEQAPAGSVAAALDPLPSWNPGPTKNTVLQFVADVTDAAGPSYVAPADRIAVFDNDGTLWTEKPVVPQAAFIFQRIAELAPEHPEWQTTPPYQAVLERDVAALQSLSAADVEKLLFATSAGLSEAEFEAAAQAFLATAEHPRFGALYTATVYQPMLELLALLRANGFKTFVVSGGGVEFIRAYSEDIYGIPRDDVVGSSLAYDFQQTAAGYTLMRQPAIDDVDLDELKPVNIQRHIGRRPILAAGNSDGDIEMLQYTGGDAGPFLNLVIVHDDAEREYAYTTGADDLMSAAAQSPWLFVSMARDFKTVFPAGAGIGR